MLVARYAPKMLVATVFASVCFWEAGDDASILQINYQLSAVVWKECFC